MDNLLKLTFVIGLISLAGCASMGMSSRPAKDVFVDIGANCDLITTQTRSKSCGGYFTTDPEGLVCQAPGADRFIIWESTVKFTLEFPDGHPFVNLVGGCKAADSNTSKRCKVKPRNETTKEFFKYDIELTEDGCRRDPHIFIRR